MTILTVTRVHKNADMRGIRLQKDSVRVTGTRCELFINKRRTIARLINDEVVVTRYADEGEVFDLPQIESMVGSLQLKVKVLHPNGLKGKSNGERAAA